MKTKIENQIKLNQTPKNKIKKIIMKIIKKQQSKEQGSYQIKKNQMRLNDLGQN